MSKLVCVVVEGLCHDVLYCAHVPCWERLKSEGIELTNLQDISPFLSLSSLYTMFTSTSPEQHGILSEHATASPSPQAVSLPVLLRYHQRHCAAFFSRTQLHGLFPAGTLQASVFYSSQNLRNLDQELASQAAYYIQKEQPDFCWLHLQGVSIMDTHFGHLSEPHLEAVEHADNALSMLIEQIALVGLQEEYTVMVMGCGCSAPQYREKNIRPLLPFVIAGPGMAGVPDPERQETLFDFAPTVAAILEIAPHPDWQGKAWKIFPQDWLSELGGKAFDRQLRLVGERGMRPAA